MVKWGHILKPTWLKVATVLLVINAILGLSIYKAEQAEQHAKQQRDMKEEARLGQAFFQDLLEMKEEVDERQRQQQRQQEAEGMVERNRIPKAVVQRALSFPCASTL